MTERPPYDLNCPGWMTEAELKFLYQSAKTMKSVVEIGSFKGRSAIALLNACERVYCVDPWNIPSYPDSIGAFVQNVRNGAERLPIMYPMPAAEAAPLIPDADMVFIDGAHEFEAVRLDISLWLPKTRRLLCGHDYYDSSLYEPGVKSAVDEWCRRDGRKLERPAGAIWAVWLQRGPQ